jgi:hypothetical protein
VIVHTPLRPPRMLSAPQWDSKHWTDLNDEVSEHGEWCSCEACRLIWRMPVDEVM